MPIERGRAGGRNAPAVKLIEAALGYSVEIGHFFQNGNYPMNWDEDIAKLELSDPEKDGLQLHRNYFLSFNNAREQKFATEVDLIWPDTARLGEVLTLICKENVKFVPVIACAFADEELAALFKVYLPDGVPGGKKAMIGRFGPISSLFNRIQFAFAFDLTSQDLLVVLDKLRGHRNKISHTWNVWLVDDFFKDTEHLNLIGLDNAMIESGLTNLIYDPQTHPELALRIRTIWLLTRLFYEALFYWRAKKFNLDPVSALYGNNHPKFLGEVANCALKFSQLTVVDGR